MVKYMGNYEELALGLARQCTCPLSLLSQEWPEIRLWRAQARAKVMELLSYQPPACPLEARVESTCIVDGLVTELVSYNQPFGPRTQAYMLYPERREGTLPGVVALHDHGGFKYFGKEKIVDMPGEHPVLADFKAHYYGGRGWATALARRGYAVFVPDVFLWGSRKMTAGDLPGEYTRALDGQSEGSAAYIEAYNAFASEYETIVAKSLFLAGTTWPGVMAYEDRRALDYFTARPEVDAARIGCGGLSGGGLRTIFLAGLDERVRCAVCVGFMSTYEKTVEKNILSHTWMLHLPHLPNYMDMPDVIALGEHTGLMVQYDTEDQIWDIEGQRAADAKLCAIYAKMGRPHAYDGRFYGGTHKFDLKMQGDAFEWFDSWLQ